MDFFSVSKENFPVSSATYKKHRYVSYWIREYLELIYLVKGINHFQMKEKHKRMESNTGKIAKPWENLENNWFRLVLNYFHCIWSTLWNGVRVGCIWSCRILFAFKNANVYVEGFVFHTCAGFHSMTPWDHGSYCGWRKWCIYVTASCKVEASSPGFYVSAVHQLSSALEMFWICFLCSEQMASLCPEQLPCKLDVSRIYYTCYMLELHVCILMICLGFLDIQKSQASAQPWALLSGRGDGGKTSSCFALLVNLSGYCCTKSHGSRASLEVGIS